MNLKPRTINLDHGGKPRVSAWLSALGVLAIGLALSSYAQTKTNAAANESPWPALESFNIIERNNIFDPNRRPPPPRGQTRTRTPLEAFALTGTMSYEKGRFAFFNGTSSAYDKVLAVGGNIAGYTVKEITSTNVTLAANGKDFKMPVGRQVRKQNGNWQMGRPVEITNDETNSEEAEATGNSSAAPVGANAQMNEILKRLMEAKAQELKESK
jgi:hypothetical protein